VARVAGFPYVRPLSPVFARAPKVFRDFPDVFHPGFVGDAEDYAGQLRETVGDAALVGYFLMNEPTRGFAEQLPAEGMLLNTPSCESRKALAGFLRDRYGDDRRLSEAWGPGTSLQAVERGPWTAPFTEPAKRDLAEFSGLMVGRFFGTLSAACRDVDPIT
jgi:hypothetical protein